MRKIRDTEVTLTEQAGLRDILSEIEELEAIVAPRVILNHNETLVTDASGR